MSETNRYILYYSYCLHATWVPIDKGMSYTRKNGTTSATYTVWECCGCGIIEIRD